MSSAEKLERIGIDRYLQQEPGAVGKSEYVDGILRAMSGALNRHNMIATNAMVELAIQLRGQPCRVFNSDTKIRIRRQHSTWFYYPDVSVICHPNPQNDPYQDRPAMIIEVLSRSTRAVDLDEKLDNYLSLSSLVYYLILEQITPQATLLRRHDQGYLRETFAGIDALIQLPEINCHLSLGSIYADIDFSPEAIREEIPDYPLLP